MVFKYPLNPQVYYIKRLIGKSGDKIEVRHGQITVNGDLAKYESIVGSGTSTSDDNLFRETLFGKKRVIKLENFQAQSFTNDGQESASFIEVPEDKFFVSNENKVKKDLATKAKGVKQNQELTEDEEVIPKAYNKKGEAEKVMAVDEITRKFNRWEV